MRIIITLILSFFFIISFGQKWSYKSGGNPFDGEYKAASVRGTGTKFPYTEPIFVVNLFEEKRLNIYVSDAGYAGCGGKEAFIKFNNDDNIYFLNVSTNDDRDTWFLESSKQFEFAQQDLTAISVIELLEKIKAHSIMYIRLRSDCGQSDFTFSLSGSSVALNYVTSKYIEKIKQYVPELPTEEEEERLLQINNMISSGVLFKAKIKNLTTLYYNSHSSTYRPPNKLIFLSDEIKPGDVVVCSYNSEDNDYYILHKAPNINIPADTIIYIKIYKIDLKTAEKIEE